ncbi:MAG: class IV adenylate cyclase [Planctomycetaceae bacterium]|nr:class IV adenylate cyclase [Planctomycetaceae bacterium]
MGMEIEAKIKVADLQPIAEKLRRLGATEEGTVLERNWVLDSDDDRLKGWDVLLRIRTTGGDEAILTVKRRGGDGEFKTREEVESRVDSADVLLKQFEMIGFRTAWIYEKKRSTWQWRDCEVVLDELPEIGCFVEIEGEPDAIRRVATDIGLDPADHINDNYLGLWQKHLMARGESERHMVFA